MLRTGRTLSSATTRPNRRRRRSGRRRAPPPAGLRDRPRGAARRPGDRRARMMAFVDTGPAERLQWNLQALALVEALSQPAAKKWEASLRNNAGLALHDLGRYPRRWRSSSAVELRSAAPTLRRRASPGGWCVDAAPRCSARTRRSRSNCAWSARTTPRARLTGTSTKSSRRCTARGGDAERAAAYAINARHNGSA